jgi:hypothetical protein
MNICVLISFFVMKKRAPQQRALVYCMALILRVTLKNKNVPFSLTHI